MDGFPHRDGPWLKPVVGHPGAPATALPLATGLAGAYGYALTAARQVGLLLYRWTMTRIINLPPALYSTTVEGVGQVEGYVPGDASKIWAEVTFASTDGEPGNALLRVSTPGDTGTTATLPVELTIDPEAVGAPYVFVAQRIAHSVTLSGTTLDDDVLVSVEFALVSEDSTRPLSAYPTSVSVWWE